MPPKAKGAPKKKTGYQMPEKFDNGFVLKDIFKNNWTLGKPIGQGGFGLIYLASKGDVKIKNPDDSQYVVKIEPKDNGPLFCESHFYVNCAKEDQIKIFMSKNGLKHLAMPKYISSGLCTYNEKEYRFLVMDRYAKDLQSFLNDSPSHQINEIGVMCILRQILYALEFIHQKGYSHGDIKGANIMLKNDHESYLVDYGLAYRFERDNLHQKYQVKPERKHNGTIEYTSRDAHDGAQTSRRADLEILGFCAVHWLSGTLPWIDMIKNPNQVQQSKVKSMENVKEFLSSCFKNVNNVSDCVKSFLEFYLNEVNKLEFETEPAYLKIQAKITETLRSLKHTGINENFRLFTMPKKSQKSSKVIDESSNEETIEEEEKSAPKRNGAKSSKVESDESDEEPAPKPTPKTKQRQPRTPKPKPNEGSKNEPNLIIRDVSSINPVSDDESNMNEKASKKARNVLQSTAIDTDLVKDKRKQILDDQTKTPVSRVKETENKRTPRATRTPNARLVRQQSFEDEQTDENKQYNGHHLIMDSPKMHSSSTNSKFNIAQTDVIQKIKSNLNEQAPPRSPLALVNLHEKENGFILVKKRKNVVKCDAWTQTDQSYLQTHKFKL